VADLQDAMNHPDFKARHHALLDELAKDYRMSQPLIERAAWKTIQLGTMPTTDALRSALLDGGFRIGDWGGDILKKITVATEPSEIELVVASVAELGFPKGATRKEIYDKAISLGFELCPAEVGPQLRLQYKDQPNGEWMLIAMEPVTDSDGDLEVFHVVHDGSGQWLSSYSGYPDFVWDAERRWVFRRK
jgi:hypothetical protein